MLKGADGTSYEVGDSFFSREQVNSLFHQPDVLMTHEYLQVYQSTSTQLPEIRLMIAVLKDAIDCYIKYLSAKNRRGKRIFNETEEWFFGQNNDDWLYSFENITSILNLDPDYIRGALRRHKEKQLRVDNYPSRHLARTLPHNDLRIAS